MDDRGLLQQLGEGPVSGDVLARRAGLTRAAIWKRIDALRTAGVEIDATPGRGYALRQPGGPSYDTIDLGVSPGDDFGPVKVPVDHVFLMGDNRDRSADSRFGLGPPENGLGGPVPWENIGGRAEFITFSLDGTSEYLNPISWFTALRGGRSRRSRLSTAH